MATTGAAPGRRERKKAATRKALADAALELFLEHGYEKVTIAQIAEAADTATTTLFAHFPAGKEALILDDSGEREASLVDAVRNRPEGSSPLDALHAFFARPCPLRRRTRPARALPARGRTDHGHSRAVALRTSGLGGLSGAARPPARGGRFYRSEPDESHRLLARYVLETPDLASSRPDRKAALAEAFRRLHMGWPEL